MDTLTLGAALQTREPRVALDARLPEGTYRVQLVVQGQAGKSAPATLVLKLVKR